MLVTIVMVDVSTSGPTGCLVILPPLSSETAQSHEKAPEAIGSEVNIIRLALGTKCEGKERVKGKASRIRSSPIGSTLVCVHRNAQHRELNLPGSTRFVLITVVMVAVSPNGPTGCLVRPPPLSSQNIPPSRNAPTYDGDRCDTAHRLPSATAVLMGTFLGTGMVGKNRKSGKNEKMQRDSYPSSR